MTSETRKLSFSTSSSSHAVCRLFLPLFHLAILPMATQYGWDTQTIGLVQSSFFWGYLLTQVLGGVWADRYGGAKVLGAGVLWWSAATALTPFAAAAGLPALLAARAAMGVGEGVAMPAMNTLLSRWVPVQERSRALALVYSGMYAGSVAGLGASPHIIHAAGWPSVFYIFGALGIVWYLCWASRSAASPGEDPRCSEEERAYITASAVAARPASSIPWKTILSKPAVWALIGKRKERREIGWPFFPQPLRSLHPCISSFHSLSFLIHSQSPTSATTGAPLSC